MIDEMDADISKEIDTNQENKNIETILCKAEPETEEFGLRFSDELKPGDVIAMTGDLGAGKTTLTKAIAKGLGIKETITSPTFTMIKEYKSGRIPLYHFDVYRLESALDPIDAFFDIGGEEYFEAGGVCVIEWADIISDAMPDNTVWIDVKYGENEGERVIVCRF